MRANTGTTVYIIQSQLDRNRYYTGITENLERRLAEHDRGEMPSTRGLRPLHLHVAVWFNDDQRAREFERYLKTGSGRAFAKRHF